MSSVESTCDEKKNEVTLRFSGKMSSQAVSEAGPETEEILDNCQERQKSCDIPLSIVFDLADVSFVGSAFIRICMRSAKRRNTQFKILNASPEVTEPFRIAGLSEWF